MLQLWNQSDNWIHRSYESLRKFGLNPDHWVAQTKNSANLIVFSHIEDRDVRLIALLNSNGEIGDLFVQPVDQEKRPLIQLMDVNEVKGIDHMAN